MRSNQTLGEKKKKGRKFAHLAIPAVSRCRTELAHERQAGDAFLSVQSLFDNPSKKEEKNNSS
jgi:hypothetical protein